MAVFFVSCPLNFEKLLVEEIKTFWFELMDLDGLPTREPFPEVFIEAGGIEFTCLDHLGYQINFFSKIARRVLIRIHQFEARFYDQFERELKVIPLAKWLPKCGIKIQIESIKSRLNHERNLLEVCDRIFPLLGYLPVHKEDAAHQLLIRIIKDKVVLSLDTSGEHLHRRGYAVYRGEAPLRENLAALLAVISKQHGYSSDRMTLIDPFAGSGTILFEMASLTQPNFKRDFAWLHFLNKPKIFSSLTWSKNYRWLESEKSMQSVAVDQDEKAIFNMEKNSALFSDLFPNIKLNLKTIHQDSCQLTSHHISSQQNEVHPFWLISNPPYGHRLKNESAVTAFKHIERVLPLEGALILHPEAMRIEFKSLKRHSEIDFINQGLNIKLSLFLKT